MLMPTFDVSMKDSTFMKIGHCDENLTSDDSDKPFFDFAAFHLQLLVDTGSRPLGVPMFGYFHLHTKMVSIEAM